MKIVNILGGLGNQMFQYALAIALREQFKNEEVLVDTSNFRGYPLHNGYELDKIFNITIRNATFREILKVGYPYSHYQLWRIGHRLLPKRKTMVTGFQSKDFTYKSINGLGNFYFDGYWQSDIFFRDYKQEIFSEFTFPEIIEDENKAILDDIKNHNSVSVHIRRGDYVNHPLFKNICTIEYYKNSLRKIKELTDVDRILIFSNDIEWCKLTFTKEFGDIHTVFVNWNSGMNSFRDMQLMSLCKHNIIANSSFSWWGAWLNQNPNKIVIAPFKWCNREANQQNYIPNSWTKIYDL